MIAATIVAIFSISSSVTFVEARATFAKGKHDIIIKDASYWDKLYDLLKIDGSLELEGSQKRRLLRTGTRPLTKQLQHSIEENSDRISPLNNLAAAPEIMNKAREFKRFILRNSSEQHIDSHANDTSNEEMGTEFMRTPDSADSVLLLQKPFHFHIPIVSGNATVSNDELPDEPDDESQTEAQTESDNDETTAEPQKETKSNRHALSSGPGTSVKQADQPDLTLDDYYDSKVVKRDIGEEILNATLTDQSNFESNYQISGSLNQSETYSHNESQQVDIDQLLKQHPNLVPPINRKRNSGDELIDTDYDDSLHLGSIVPHPIEYDDAQDDPRVETSKRGVKTIKFSQAAVDSILKHDDDFVKYRQRIESHAHKLGLPPHEVFHAMVYGKNSTGEPETEFHNNNKDVHQRRKEFHHLFLEDESSKISHNDVVFDKEDAHVGKKRYDETHIKIIRRYKRGLKSWIKGLFKGKDKRNDEVSGNAHSPKRKRPEDKIDHDEESSKYNHRKTGDPASYDTAVDLLLPKALRRSSFVKAGVEKKVLEKIEENFEEEYEKSEEKEIKIQSHQRQRKKASRGSDEFENDASTSEERHNKKKKKEPRRGHDRKRREIHDGPHSEIESLSKNELLLLEEMLANLIEAQCEGMSESVLDNFFSVTQALIDFSSLPDYVQERRNSVDHLFNQILDCSAEVEQTSGRAQIQNKDLPTLLQMNGFSSSDKPLRRIKRVRRGNELPNNQSDINTIEEELSEEQLINNQEQKATTDIDASIVFKFIKLHLLLNKVILSICPTTVEAELLRRTIFFLIEEVISMMKNDRNYHDEIGQFMGHFDINLAEQQFRKCFIDLNLPKSV